MLSASGSAPPAPRVSISDQTLTVAAAGGVSVGYQVSSGSHIFQTGTTTGLLETWLLLGASGDYEVRATVTAGALTTGIEGTWQKVNVDRQWVVSANGHTQNCTLLIEIRDAMSLTVLDSATIDLSAQST